MRLIVVTAWFAVALAPAADAARRDGAFCDGQPATVVGTDAAETINGTAGNDVVVALGGNDTINGNGGDDVICGGDGNDIVTGGAGDDSIDGGAGTDRTSYLAAPGPVTVDLGAGTATGDGNDTLIAVEDAHGSKFADVLTGDGGANRLIGYLGDDLINGGAGNDVLLGDVGDDTLNGGDGNDTLNIDTTPSSSLLFNGGLLINDHDAVAVRIGTFAFDADAANGTANLAVSVSADGTAIFNSTQHLESLTIDNGGNAGVSANGSRVLVTRALTIAATGKLDLTNNDLVLNYSMVSPAGTWNGSAYSGVSGMIQSGYNGGAWNGNGIRTSSATSITQLGVAEASQVLGISGAQTGLFSGETVDASSVLVKYTYTGDATLDGKLNVDDYGKIDFNAPFTGSVFGYYNGDFTFDGKINVDDYGKLDFALNLQGLPL
jgi:hypothetical protein